MEAIVDCGRLATGRSEQPWEFVVVTDPDIKQQIADATDYGKFIAQAAACIAVFCEIPNTIWKTALQQLKTVLVGAWALGSWHLLDEGDKKHYVSTIGTIVGAPENTKLVSLIALGYPAEQPTRPKRELAEVLHWNRF